MNPEPSRQRGDHILVDRRLLSGSTWLLAGQMATLVSGLAVLVAISRFLSPEDVGRWRVAQAVLAYLLVFADSGFTSYAIRELSRRPTPVSAFGWTMLLTRIASASASLAAVGVVALATRPANGLPTVILIMGASALATALSAGYVLQALESFATTAKIRIATQVIAAVGAISMVVLARSLELAAVAIVVAAITAAVVSNVAAARLGAFSARPNLELAAPMIRGAVPFIGAGFAALVIFNADAFLIAILRGERALGFYAAPYAIAGYSLVIGGAVMAAAYPRMARTSEKMSQRTSLQELCGVMGVIALPIAVGGIVTAGPLLQTLFGEAYAESAGVLALLMAIPLVGFLNMTLGQAMAAGGQQPAAFGVAAAAAGTNVVANLVMIPTFGIFGAAIVAAGTEFVTLVLYASVCARRGITVPFARYLGSGPAATVMGGALVLAKAVGVESVVVLIPLGAAVYVGAQTIRPSAGARSLRNVFARPARPAIDAT